MYKPIRATDRRPLPAFAGSAHVDVPEPPAAAAAMEPPTASRSRRRTPCTCRRALLIVAVVVIQTMAIIVATLTNVADVETAPSVRSFGAGVCPSTEMTDDGNGSDPCGWLRPGVNESTASEVLDDDLRSVVTRIEPTSMWNETSEECVESFLTAYESFCEQALRPSASRLQGVCSRCHQQLCPCVPRQRLLGRQALTPPVLSSWPGLAEVIPGGQWTPMDCVARQRIAVIIPFRDRESHLASLLNVLHPLLQRQLVEYTIFVVEQDKPRNIFNKASMMNAGFVEVLRHTNSSPFDCFVFHDVDMLPEDDRNFYGCAVRLPRHVGAFVGKWNYRLFYYRLFGGATAFRPEVFVTVNGFSNEFYGWGGEDDDMLNRIEAKNMTFVRFPSCVAKYTMIKHDKDKRNPYNRASGIAWKQRKHVYSLNGLTSLRHQLVSVELRPLYTWLLVSVPPGN